MKQEKSSRDWSFRVKDILNSIDKIELYVENMTFTQFKNNELVIDAVIRNFEVIGEASNNIPLSIQKKHPNIPWRQVIGLRNFLIHEYFGIDIHVVWQTIQNHLPNLKKQLQVLIQES